MKYGLQILFTLLIALHTGLEAKVYKWTDENGELHFGSIPPPSANKKEVKIRASKSDAGARMRLQKMTRGYNNGKKKEKKQKVAKKKSQKTRDDNKKVCERYQKRVDKYRREGVMGYNVLTGEKKKMDSQQAQAAIDDAQETADIFCN